MSVKTRSVQDRRTLSFSSLEDILADVESIDGATANASGNWTPAQNVQHLAKFIRQSLDGFEFDVPLPLKLIGKMIKNRTLTSPMSPGYKFPTPAIPSVAPDDDVTWDDAVAQLRALVERVRAGERMTVRSPLFGTLDHDEWVKLHCRHAEMHLSFIGTE